MGEQAMRAVLATMGITPTPKKKAQPRTALAQISQSPARLPAASPSGSTASSDIRVHGTEEKKKVLTREEKKRS